MINLHKLNELKGLAGSEFSKMIESFERDVEHMLASLSEASTNSDAEKMVISLHALKGIGANMGCTQLFTHSQELEQLARANRLHNPEEQFEDLEKICMHTIAALKDEAKR